MTTGARLGAVAPRPRGPLTATCLRTPLVAAGRAATLTTATSLRTAPVPAGRAAALSTATLVPAGPCVTRRTAALIAATLVAARRGATLRTTGRVPTRPAATARALATVALGTPPGTRPPAELAATRTTFVRSRTVTALTAGPRSAVHVARTGRRRPVVVASRAVPAARPGFDRGVPAGPTRAARSPAASATTVTVGSGLAPRPSTPLARSRRTVLRPAPVRSIRRTLPFERPPAGDATRRAASRREGAAGTRRPIVAAAGPARREARAPSALLTAPVARRAAAASGRAVARPATTLALSTGGATRPERLATITGTALGTALAAAPRNAAGHRPTAGALAVRRTPPRPALASAGATTGTPRPAGRTVPARPAETGARGTRRRPARRSTGPPVPAGTGPALPGASGVTAPGPSIVAVHL